MGIKINWDALGIGASIACAIHCAVLPLTLTSLPLFGINIIHNYAFEYFMIGLAFSIGSYALWHGYRQHHRSFLPFVLFIVGILCLLAKQHWHQHELLILPFAVIFIVSAHITNFRSCRLSGHHAQSPKYHPAKHRYSINRKLAEE
ncbi:MAG: MerC domain-containing protein [Bacteroidetes bacterium]|nr:MerC domain-containing protein [Bacteroidota bacterium]MBS1975280.1 MerC domain-containing protein [Bacteroidota bacterium]